VQIAVLAGVSDNAIFVGTGSIASTGWGITVQTTTATQKIQVLTIRPSRSLATIVCSLLFSEYSLRSDEQTGGQRQNRQEWHSRNNRQKDTVTLREPTATQRLTSARYALIIFTR